jgi:hypothetical protein
VLPAVTAKALLGARGKFEIEKPASISGDANTGDTGSISITPAGFEKKFPRLDSEVNAGSHG